MEYSTPVGRIDLLTKDTLFEFKHFKKFKEALGQVLAYNTYVKMPILCIVLFDCPRDFRHFQQYKGQPSNRSTHAFFLEISKICETHKVNLEIVFKDSPP